MRRSQQEQQGTDTTMVDSSRQSQEQQQPRSGEPVLALAAGNGDTLQQNEEIEISVNRAKSRAITTQGILLSLVFIVVLGVSCYSYKG